jgi:hypothetical protein
MSSINGTAYKGQIVDNLFTGDNKYIWSAEEILMLGDKRLDYLHQFRGYKTAAGWNIIFQALIPIVGKNAAGGSGGYRWVSTRRYFRKQRFPNAVTVKDVILECVKLPYMIEPLTKEYNDAAKS